MTFVCDVAGKDILTKCIVIDYLILNRDRHGANYEILRNTREHSLTNCPLFDHGLSLMYSCMSDQDIDKFDIMEDKDVMNFIGGYYVFDNLQIVEERKSFLSGKLQEKDINIYFWMDFRILFRINLLKSLEHDI